MAPCGFAGVFPETVFRFSQSFPEKAPAPVCGASSIETKIVEGLDCGRRLIQSHVVLVRSISMDRVVFHLTVVGRRNPDAFKANACDAVASFPIVPAKAGTQYCSRIAQLFSNISGFPLARG
jgi:hypothetical protein